MDMHIITDLFCEQCELVTLYRYLKIKKQNEARHIILHNILEYKNACINYSHMRVDDCQFSHFYL